MKIKLDINEAFIRKIKNALYITSRFKEESLLSTVRLTTTDNGLKFELISDTDKAILNIQCQILESGNCRVNAEKFVSLLQSFNGELIIETTDRLLYIRQNKTTIKLPTVRDDVFAGLRSLGDEYFTTTLASDKLASVVDVVTPFVDSINASVCSGVNINIDNNIMTVMSCHSAAMAIAKLPVQTDSDNAVEGTIKVNVLQAISRMFDSTVKLGIDRGVLGIKDESCTLFTSLIAGKFPPLGELVEKNGNKLTIDRKQLELCIRRISILHLNSKRINLICNNDTIQLVYEQDLLEFIQGTFEGNCTIKINYDYLTIILKLNSQKQIVANVMPSGRIQFEQDNYTIAIAPLV